MIDLKNLKNQKNIDFGKIWKNGALKLKKKENLSVQIIFKKWKNNFVNKKIG